MPSGLTIAHLVICSRSRDRNSTPATEAATVAPVGRDSFPSPPWRMCRQYAAPNSTPMASYMPWARTRRRSEYAPTRNCTISGENFIMHIYIGYCNTILHNSILTCKYFFYFKIIFSRIDKFWNNFGIKVFSACISV